MPCTTVASALATSRPNIKITGSIAETVSITDRALAIVAAPKGTLAGSVHLMGTSNVTIQDLTLGSCSIDRTATASLQRVLISGGGIRSSGTVTLTESTVSDVGATGGTLPAVYASSGSLTITRSRIMRNHSGGIGVEGATAFDIENNFIAGNGSTLPLLISNGGSRIGGVSLTSTVASKLIFNSVVWNYTADGVTAGTYPAGIVCSGALIDAHGNIASQNDEGMIEGAQAVGTCPFGNTYTASSENLGFASSSTDPFDLHLTDASPATIVDAAGSCDGIDYDGLRRPMGAACDLGADEKVP